MYKMFSYNNGWAIDSTFKTNQFGLPLYATVPTNKQGMGIPLWYMIYTSDGYRHEQYALEVTLKVMFERMNGISVGINVPRSLRCMCPNVKPEVERYLGDPNSKTARHSPQQRPST